MFIRNYRYHLVILFVLAFTPNIFAQKQTPVEAVKSFYKFHNSRSGIFSLHEVKIRKRWLSAALYELFMKELKREDEFTRKNPSEKPHFGDGFPLQPFSECVDGEKVVDNLYEAGEISSDEKKALVEVKFYTPEKCGKELIETYRIELIKTKTGWLLNDWIYPDGTKLTDDLNRKDY